MSLDVSNLEDRAIARCESAADAQSVLWFFAAIYQILNADCKCGTAKVGERQVDIQCWPCILRAARDRDRK